MRRYCGGEKEGFCGREKYLLELGCFAGLDGVYLPIVGLFAGRFPKEPALPRSDLRGTKPYGEGGRFELCEALDPPYPLLLLLWGCCLYDLVER